MPAVVFEMPAVVFEMPAVVFEMPAVVFEMPVEVDRARVVYVIASFPIWYYLILNQYVIAFLVTYMQFNCIPS